MSSAIVEHGIYTCAEVARLLFRHDVEWFYRYRDGQGRAEGFPRPISPTGQPRWSGRALLAWIDRPNRDSPAVSLAPEASNIVDIAERLRQRSQAMAAKGRRRLSR